ncbi:MAG: hypothetical protein PVJ53_01745 [Desulfobacterales bacterium]|jgi:hypothetical protein
MPATDSIKRRGAARKPCPPTAGPAQTGLLWWGRLLVLLLICGCAAGAGPQNRDGERLPAPETSAKLDFPTTGPAGAAVTMTVYEDYQ